MKTLIVLLVLLAVPALASTEQFMHKEINATQLSETLVSAGYHCIIVQSNRVMQGGSVVLDPETNRPKVGPRYILLKCKEPIDRSLVSGIIADHIPIIPALVPTQEEIRKQEIRDEAKLLLRELGLID